MFLEAICYGFPSFFKFRLNRIWILKYFWASAVFTSNLTSYVVKVHLVPANLLFLQTLGFKVGLTVLNYTGLRAEEGEGETEGRSTSYWSSQSLVSRLQKIRLLDTALRKNSPELHYSLKWVLHFPINSILSDFSSQWKFSYPITLAHFDRC